MAACSIRSLSSETTNNLLQEQEQDHLKAFESLKICFTKLDHSPQNFKASVGRSGAHGQRRPPSRCSRAHSSISSKSSTESFQCIYVDKEATSVPTKVVNIDIQLEDSQGLQKVNSNLRESSINFKSNQNREFVESNQSQRIVESCSYEKQKDSQTIFDKTLPSISPTLLKLFCKSKAYCKNCNRSEGNIISIPSLANSVYLSKSKTSSSLSALDVNRHHKQSIKSEDLFDSQSYHSDSCLTSSVLLRNILNTLKITNTPTYPDSSSDTEVVIGDRESVIDSGEVNRRTSIHIREKDSLKDNIQEPTDKNNNCQKDHYAHSYLYSNSRENKTELSDPHLATSNLFNIIEDQSNVYGRKSRMFVRQSDSSNRPTRASAFNVRQTIEKRQVQQERRDRRALRKKIREQLRSSSVGRKDSDSLSLNSSEASNLSKSLSSLDENEDIILVDPLFKAQSSPTLESDKKSIRTYLFGTNLTTEPSNTSVSNKFIDHIKSNIHEKLIDSDKENYIYKNHPKEVSTDYNRPSLSERCLNQEVLQSQSQYGGRNDLNIINRRISLTPDLQYSLNNNSVEKNLVEFFPVPPPRRRSRISSSAGQLTVDKKDNSSWLRQAKERRSLRSERRPFDDISENSESILESEPDWVGKARKKLESMNVFLTSTTDTVSVSSVISDSSAWSRGGLDALEDLKEEVGRMSDVLSEEALQKVESDLGLSYKERKMIEYPSIPEHPDEQQKCILPSNDSYEKDEVRFGNLIHDWGGIPSERTQKRRPYPNKVGKENFNKNNNNTSSKRSSPIIEDNKTQKMEKIKLMHFGDSPQDLVSKQSVILGNQKSSKFESICGPDPLTMSVEQLNQNVEEYDFPVPTGKEDSQALLKILEQSLKKDEIVPEFTSDIENEPKPKSILKRRSNQEKKDVNNLANDDHMLENSRVYNSFSDRRESSKNTNSKPRTKSDKRFKIREFNSNGISSGSQRMDQNCGLDKRRSTTGDNIPKSFYSSPTANSRKISDSLEKSYSKGNNDGNCSRDEQSHLDRSGNYESSINYNELRGKYDSGKGHIEQTSKNIHTKLSDWEELHRQRLENEERKKVNRGILIRPVSDKIKDLIRSHAGIRHVFNKERNNKYNGTVNAKEIIFKKIPSVRDNAKFLDNEKRMSNSGNVSIKPAAVVNPHINFSEKVDKNNTTSDRAINRLSTKPEVESMQPTKHNRPLSSYLFNLPDSFSKTVSFDRFHHNNKSLGNFNSKRNIELHPNKIISSISQASSKFSNDKTSDVTGTEQQEGEFRGDKINPLSVGNRNSICRSSYPSYKASALNRLDEYNKENEDKNEMKFYPYNKLHNSEKKSNLKSGDHTNNNYSKKVFSRPSCTDHFVNPIKNLQFPYEGETTKENICPNRGNYNENRIPNKNNTTEKLNSSYDSFPDSITSPRESLERFGSERRSMTRVQNLRDRKYSAFDRSNSPVALSDKSYLLDRNRSGSPSSRISCPSRDRRQSLRSVSSLRSTPDREGPVSLSSILSRDTCSQYSSNNQLSAHEELGKLTSRYQKNRNDRESSIDTNTSDISYTYPQLHFDTHKLNYNNKYSLKRKSSDTLSSIDQNNTFKNSNKQVKSYLSSRKTPPRSIDRSPLILVSSRLQKKDSNKNKDRLIAKKSTDTLSMSKSSLFGSKKDTLKRIDSNASTRSERDEELEYYENLKMKSGEGWAKTKIRKTKLGKPLREKKSLSRENSGSSSNSRHLNKASVELEKWAAQAKTSGKLVKKEGHRYSHEVEEEEKNGKKSAKAISRKVVRRGSRRMSKGGDIVTETKEIAKGIPSKPPKILHNTYSKESIPNKSLKASLPQNDRTRKLKTKTDGERFMMTSVKTVKGINTTTTEGVDNKNTKSVEVIGGKGWEGEREVAGRHGERLVVERHIGKGVRPSTVLKKATSNSKIITTKTKMKPLYAY